MSDAKNIVLAIVVVFLLITISQNRNKKSESMYAANWVGQPGADSVTRAAPLLVKV